MSFDVLFDQVRSQRKGPSSEDISENQPSNFDTLFEEVKSKTPSRTKSLISAPIKGVIKGAASFSPLPSLGPVSGALGNRITEQVLPTQKKGLEDVLEFAGENAPIAAMGPGGIAKKGVQALAGGLAKKGAKELNLPEWAQDIVGGVGMLSPDLLKAGSSKALRPAAKQQAVFDFLKSKGVSEKDITPIIQDPKKLAWVSKAAAKFEKKDPWIKGIKEKLGIFFEDLREKGSKSPFLEGKPLMDFEDKFMDKLEKVPRMYRGLIKKEVEDLFKNPINFTELHDFSKAVNAIVRDVEGGKAAIGILKEPIEEIQRKIYPDLYKDLKLMNKSYSQMSDFTDKMTRKNWDALLSFGQTGGALLGFLTLNPTLIKTTLGYAAIKSAAKQILTNPRLQNIHSKMWQAFLKNDIPAALKLMELFRKESESKD